MLKEGITIHSSLIDNVEQEIYDIDSKVDVYRSLILEEGKRDSKIRNNNFLLKKGCKYFLFSQDFCLKFKKLTISLL